MDKITYLANDISLAKNTTLIKFITDSLTTNRTIIIKFNACHEALPALLKDSVQCISLPFNDEEALEKTFTLYGDNIAAVVIEPALTSKGLILPQYGFLDSVRELTQENGAALILDERVTGNQTNGGCQNIFEVEPDFTCWSELPTKDATQHYNAESMTAILTGGLERAAKTAGVPVQIHRLGSMFSIFFTATPLTDYASAVACDEQAYQKFYATLAEQDIILPSTQLATNFVSPTHTAEAIQATIDAAAKAFAQIAQD